MYHPTNVVLTTLLNCIFFHFAPLAVALGLSKMSYMQPVDNWPIVDIIYLDSCVLTLVLCVSPPDVSGQWPGLQVPRAQLGQSLLESGGMQQIKQAQGRLNAPLQPPLQQVAVQHLCVHNAAEKAAVKEIVNGVLLVTYVQNHP